MRGSRNSPGIQIPPDTQVHGRHLAAQTGTRRFTNYPERAGFVPVRGYELSVPVRTGQLLDEPCQDLRLVKVAQARVDAQRQVGLAGRALLLEELVVARAAAKLGGQTALEDLNEFVDGIAHALGSELLVAADAVDVQGQTELVHPAAAVPLIQRRIVAVLGVEQQPTR